MQRLLPVALALAASCALATGSAFAAKPKPKPKPVPSAGKPCAKLGLKYGKKLDCVKVGSALQWQPKGRQVNPYPLRFAGTFATTAGQPLVYRFSITDPATVVAPADIGAPDASRLPIPAGSVPVRIRAVLENLGKQVGDPGAALASFAFVDAAGAEYGLYGAKECEAYGTTGLPDRLSLRSDPPGANAGTLCAVIPKRQVNAKLLFRITTQSSKGLSAIWFKTTA